VSTYQKWKEKLLTTLPFKKLPPILVAQTVIFSTMWLNFLGTLNTLTFIKRKRCGRIKARTCAHGRPQRDLYQKWEAYSPTVRTESVLFTSMLDAHEGRIVGVYNIPGAFLHAKQTDLTYVRMTGDAAKLLVEILPDSYKQFMISERGKDVTYLILKRLYTDV
jgi:hypothetical protein